METYLTDNKWRLTWSKLKCFKFCPMQYKLKYVDEIQGQESRVLIVGTALHYLVEVWIDQFSKHYQILEPNKRKGVDDGRVILNNSEGKASIKCLRGDEKESNCRYELRVRERKRDNFEYVCIEKVLSSLCCSFGRRANFTLFLCFASLCCSPGRQPNFEIQGPPPCAYGPKHDKCNDPIRLSDLWNRFHKSVHSCVRCPLRGH